MLKKAVSNKFFITSLLLSTFLISGCTHSPASTPVASIQKTFSNELDIELLQEAITKAAEKNNWDIIEPTLQSINLKKSYVVKKREVSALRTKRRYKPAIKKDLYVNVDLNKKYFMIKPAQKYEELIKSESQRKQFNQELANLEEAIYTELAAQL